MFFTQKASMARPIARGVIYIDLFILILIVAIQFADAGINKCQLDIQAIKSRFPNQKKLRLILEMNPLQVKNTKDISSIVNQASQKIPMRITKQFQYSPLISVEIDRDNLSELAKLPGIQRIHIDELSMPTLHESIHQVGADLSWNLGYTGQDQLVAIIDTGVDLTHEFFADKKIVEACFSSRSDGYDSQSLCPDGQEISYVKNSASPCSLDMKGCDHGTHVAGISAGRNEEFSGVARDAGIMAIQVFSKFYDTEKNNNICKRMGKSSPCIMSFASDQIKGLEYIYNQRTKLNIAAVNMSLSGGKPYAKACDDDPRNAIINQLYQAGIAVIASSGNSGYDHAIGAPACISHVISVGAVDNNDIIQSFSNSSDLLDFLAPGYAIQSSIPEHGFHRKTGTSMAAPHVTGAWAIMRSKYNNASNDKILQLLKNNAPMIMDHRNSTSVSRIQIDWAASDIPILLPDKTIENQVDFHSWHYYRIVNQAAECQYTVRLHNLSDDADLYFRHTDIPTLDQWDIRPYKGTQCSESLQFLAENHDVWFVGVYGYRAAQYHLSLNSQPVYQLKPDSNSQQPIEKHAWHYYVTDVSRIKQVRVDSLKGDADLYCQIGQLPDKLNYFKKSNKNQRYPDICELQLSYTPKKLYVGIYGYQAGRYEIHAE